MTTCALVATSDFNADVFLRMNKQTVFDEVVAVDAGLKHLEKINVTPNLAIGDFDSLGYTPENVNVKKYPSHKDASDMELALSYVKNSGHNSVVVFGALGNRLDHTLANLQVFSHYSELGIRVSVVGVSEELTFLTGPSSKTFDKTATGYVSIIAMNDEVVGLFERGLKWEVENGHLTSRTSLGLSNEFKGHPSEISVEKGTILIHRCLNCSL